MKKISLTFVFLVVGISFSSFYYNTGDFKSYIKDFAKDYTLLNIPQLAYDYRDYYHSIPSVDHLNNQRSFFDSQTNKLNKFNREKLTIEERIIFDHIKYELEFNKERIQLELNWIRNGSIIPINGLNKMKDGKDWYKYFIQKFTSLKVKPEDIMNYGIQEVKRINEEIGKIQQRNGFSSKEDFYKHLENGSFYYTNKTDIIKAFAHCDSCVRANLKFFIGEVAIPRIYAMEWPDAGPNTPPGIYLGSNDNAFGKDVFQYNFYEGKYNRRAIDWIFMHEAIPGHHLQSSLRKQTTADEIQDLFLYSGNFEGWACYVEYEGKSLGLYKDDYSYLGKWEWDLIRSARLVLETGIHYYGWSKEKALEYWQANIYGQDEIAEREITRVTNWPGQALSYKIGAKFIFDLKEKLKIDANLKTSQALFHECYLNFGMRPLPVIEENLGILFNSKK